MDGRLQWARQILLSQATRKIRCADDERQKVAELRCPALGHLGRRWPPCPAAGVLGSRSSWAASQASYLIT